MNTTHTPNNTTTETETHNMNTHTITLSGEQFQALATLTAVAKAADDVTPVLQTVAIETDGHTLTAYTTDRYRVAALTVETETDNGQTETPVLVHWKDLYETARTAKPTRQLHHPLITITATHEPRTVTTQTGTTTHPRISDLTIETDNGHSRRAHITPGSYPPIMKLVTDHRAKLDNSPAAKSLALNPKYLADIAKLKAPGDKASDAATPWQFHTMSNEDGKPAPLLATREGKGYALTYLLQPNLIQR